MSLEIKVIISNLRLKFTNNNINTTILYNFMFVNLDKMQ